MCSFDFTFLVLLWMFAQWLCMVLWLDEDVCQGDLERIRENISDLIMWRDVAKSTLWFGFGCICFLSSCFAAKGFNFRYIDSISRYTYLFSFNHLSNSWVHDKNFVVCSVFSAISYLGLLFLGVSFLSNTLRQRYKFFKVRVHYNNQACIIVLIHLLPSKGNWRSAERAQTEWRGCITNSKTHASHHQFSDFKDERAFLWWTSNDTQSKVYENFAIFIKLFPMNLICPSYAVLALISGGTLCSNGSWVWLPHNIVEVMCVWYDCWNTKCQQYSKNMCSCSSISLV